MRLIEEVKGFKSTVKDLNQHKSWRLFCWLVATYAFSSIWIGVAYLPISNVPSLLPRGLAVVSEAITPLVWGISWILCGVWTFFAAITGLRVIRPFIFTFALSLLWALIYFVGFLMVGGRSYLGFVLYVILAVVPLMVMWAIVARKELRRSGR
jgi:hypothetical protein